MFLLSYFLSYNNKKNQRKKLELHKVKIDDVTCEGHTNKFKQLK